jgi:hypothetical protein
MLVCIAIDVRIWKWGLSLRQKPRRAAQAARPKEIIRAP